MATSPADFMTQQHMADQKHAEKTAELKNKKTSDLEDHEKIFLLKREIDDLRTQVNQNNKNEPALGSASSSNSSTNVCNGPLCGKTSMLALFMFVGIALVLRWGRKRGIFNNVSGGSRKFRTSGLLGGSDGEGVTTVQFELQGTTNNAAPTDMYRAPDATVVQFV